MTDSEAADSSTSSACGSPNGHLSTIVPHLAEPLSGQQGGRRANHCLHCRTGNEPKQHPCKTFQQHPPHQQTMLKPRLCGTIKSCPEWENRVTCETTDCFCLPPEILPLSPGCWSGLYRPERIFRINSTGLCQNTGQKLVTKSKTKPYPKEKMLLMVPERGGGSRWVSS